jgi:hypothetical protein
LWLHVVKSRHIRAFVTAGATRQSHLFGLQPRAIAAALCALWRDLHRD